MQNATPSAALRVRRAMVGTFGAALVASPLALVATSATAADDAAEWSYSRTVLDTVVAQGYQMGVDEVNRKVYFTDAQARTDIREKVPTYDTEGNVSGYTWAYSTTGGSAKVVEYDMASKRKLRDLSYLDLTRLGANAKKEGEAHSWEGVADDVTRQSSLRTHFSPNGIAIDPTTTYDGVTDPTIITTHVRQRGLQPDGTDKGHGGGIVIFRASQDAPTDADRLWEFDDKTPISDNSRRVAVDTRTHKAYITNMADRGRSKQGYVTVIDLLTKKVDARVAIPAPVDTRALNGGVIGVSVDEENGFVYAGIITQANETTDLTKLFRIDANSLDTSDPKNVDLNAAKVTELDALLPSNVRPKYVAEDKRIYASSYDSGTISVIDADPASAKYGQLIDSVVDGETNMVTVDAERNLLYSAGLGEKTVKVYDTETLDKVLTIPTYSRANDIALDPATGEVWVGYFSFGGTAADKTEVFDVQAPSEADVEFSTSGSTFGKAGKASIVVTDADGDALTGTVTVTGAGAPITATLKRGEAVVTLPKSLRAGKHTLTATYAGQGKTRTGSATAVQVVGKDTVKLSGKVSKKATAKKDGKVTLKVTSAVAGTPATGEVTVTLKKGKATKKVTGTLKKGNKVTIKLPKLKKGTWAATAKYAGAANYKAAKAKKFKVKVTRR